MLLKNDSSYQVKKLFLFKLAKISGWMLLIILFLYFVSGYAMVHEFGMDKVLHRHQAYVLHKILAIPFLVCLILHIMPYQFLKSHKK